MEDVVEEVGVEEDPVRDKHQRVAAWLGVDISDAKTGAQADVILYNAKVHPSMVSDAEVLGVNITGLPYGAAKDPIQKARARWSRRALKENGWKEGTLLVWTKHQGPLGPEDEDPSDEEAQLPGAPEATLWVITRVKTTQNGPTGMVTIKPFGIPTIQVTPLAKGSQISLVVPTASTFLHLSAFRLRDAKVIDAADINLY